MGSKAKVERFDTLNKSKIKGKIGHTRTGACTAPGKCYHADKPNNFKAKSKKTKSKI